MPRIQLSSSTPSRPYLYLPDGWDTGWKAAKAAVGSSPQVVAYLGDSIGAGCRASDGPSKGLCGLLRTYLTGLYGSYGDFYNQFLSNSLGSGYAGTYPWTYQANWNSGGAGALGSYGSNSSALAFGTTGDVAFATPYACTALDLIARDTLSGGPWTWQYNVDKSDGTGLTTYTLGGGTALNGSIYRVSLSGLASATHTVRIGNANVSGGLQLSGALTYQPGASAGILFANNAISGGYSYHFANGVDPAGRPWQAWQGTYKSNSTTTIKTGFGYPAGASLAFLEWGINDCASFQPPDEMFFHTSHRIIQALRRASPNCSIVILIPCNPDPDSSDSPGFFGTQANNKRWPLYIRMLYQLAQAYTCALVNIHAKWGETPYASGFIGSADPHPIDAGYADIAATIESVL
jgi:hypothetical protein